METLIHITQDDLDFFKRISAEIGDIKENDVEDVIFALSEIPYADFKRFAKLAVDIERKAHIVVTRYTDLRHDMIGAKNYKYLSWVYEGFDEDGNLGYEITESYDGSYDSYLHIPIRYLLEDDPAALIYQECLDILQQRNNAADQAKIDEAKEKRLRDIETLKRLREQYPDE